MSVETAAQPPQIPPAPLSQGLLAALSGPKQEDPSNWQINQILGAELLDVNVEYTPTTAISASGSSYDLSNAGSMSLSGTFEFAESAPDSFNNFFDLLTKPIPPPVQDTRSVVMQARRLKRIRLGIAEILATLQGGHLMCLSTEVPRTAKVADIRYSKETNYFEMVLEDESFDLVTEAETIPMIPGPAMAVFDLDFEPLQEFLEGNDECEPLRPMLTELQLDYQQEQAERQRQALPRRLADFVALDERQ